MMYPSGRTVYYGYHDSGALDQISDNADLSDPIARYDYIGGRTLMRRMQNGIHLDLARRDPSGNPTGYSWYDTLGRPEKWAHFNTLDVNPSGSANLLIGFGHAYDRAGNKTKQDSLHDPKDNQTYRYDSTGRLVGYDRGDLSGQTWPEMASARDYWLDGLGNWDWVKTLTGGTTVTETRNHTTFNEIASWNDGASSGTLGHDDNGNMLEKEDFTLTWDAFNRMSMADDLDVNPSGTSIRYVYDTGNRRVAIIKQDLSVLPAEASTEVGLYLYGGWQVLEERQTPTLEQSASSTLHRQFVYGNYIDEPLVMDTNEDNDGDCIGAGDERLFYHQNTLFSVYALTDTEGNIVEAYVYDPYGKHIVITDGDLDGKVYLDTTDTRTEMGTGDHANPFTFTGRRYDADTGLHYYRNRYYDYRFGTFISRDPLKNNVNIQNNYYEDDDISYLRIGNKNTYSLLTSHDYSYTASNPIAWNDPTGLYKECHACNSTEQSELKSAESSSYTIAIQAYILLRFKYDKAYLQKNYPDLMSSTYNLEGQPLKNNIALFRHKVLNNLLITIAGYASNQHGVECECRSIVNNCDGITLGYVSADGVFGLFDNDIHFCDIYFSPTPPLLSSLGYKSKTEMQKGVFLHEMTHAYAFTEDEPLGRTMAASISPRPLAYSNYAIFYERFAKDAPDAALDSLFQDLNKYAKYAGKPIKIGR